MANVAKEKNELLLEIIAALSRPDAPERIVVRFEPEEDRIVAVTGWAPKKTKFSTVGGAEFMIPARVSRGSDDKRIMAGKDCRYDGNHDPRRGEWTVETAKLRTALESLPSDADFALAVSLDAYKATPAMVRAALHVDHFEIAWKVKRGKADREQSTMVEYVVTEHTIGRFGVTETEEEEETGPVASAAELYGSRSAKGYQRRSFRW